MMNDFYQRDRVHTPEQVELWRGGAPLAGRRMTTAVVGTNMKEVPAFSQMEVAHVTMKIRGATTGTTFTSLLNVEPFHPQGGARAPPPHSVRSQGIYPAPRSLPESGEDTLVQAILNLDRAEDRDHYRRKAAPFPPLRERSPVRREVARSPHSRSGSSVSSRGYSPDRAKSLPFPSQQGKRYEEPYSQSKMTDKISGLSREGSPHSATSNKEENHPPEGEKEEPVVVPVVEDSQKSTENFQERRALAIAAKAQEIEKVYRQDCETFGMVVKMLISKDPNLEKQLQVPLRENLGEIRERCLEDLKHFISELDEAVRQPEPSVCESTNPSTSLAGHKLSKTGMNHNSSF